MFWLKAVTFLTSFEDAQLTSSVKALGQKTYTWYIMPFNKFMEAVELLDVVMRLAYRIVQN